MRRANWWAFLRSVAPLPFSICGGWMLTDVNTSVLSAFGVIACLIAVGVCIGYDLGKALNGGRQHG